MPRLDRFGDAIDEDAATADLDHLCVDGWIGEDQDGRPRPCPTCRGHLARRTDTPASGYRLRIKSTLGRSLQGNTTKKRTSR
jgi:hypothetical protein